LIQVRRHRITVAVWGVSYINWSFCDLFSSGLWS
jgi:hypothetical protein